MSNNICDSPLPTSLDIEQIQNIPWWNRRTKLEVALCFVTLISLLMLSVVTVTLASITSYKQKDKDNSSFTEHGICLTHGCMKAAFTILEKIDEKVDPCQNFYEFACGGFLRGEISDDLTEKSIEDEVADKLYFNLKNLLRRPLNDSEPRFVKLLRDMYDTCMDTKAINRAGDEPLKEMLKTLGGWPAVEGNRWDETKFDWLETLLAFRRLGYYQGTLLQVEVYPYYKNNTIHVIELDQCSLGMPGREYMMKGLNDSGVAAYLRLMVKAANKLGADEATSEKELTEALRFEISLANYSLPLEKRRNISNLYRDYTLKSLQELVPQVNWLKYFNGLFNDPITEDETIVVIDQEYVKKFGELIATTDKRTIANYMMWRTVWSSMYYLTKEWKDLGQDYFAVIYGNQEQEPRWKQCMMGLYSSLGTALSSYYVKNFFQEENKEQVLELVKYMRQEFLNNLDNIEWMDDNTKAHARDKAKAMQTIVGYPQELIDENKVSKLYENVTLTNDSYFSKRMRRRKGSIDYGFNKLRTPPVKGDWRRHAIAVLVNAFHYGQENIIDIRAGYLQNPFFDKDQPYYMNFGAIGEIIGHEITHGFDHKGRLFDKDGNYKNWWAEETAAKFEERANCLVYQYGNYTVEDGLHLNGINTLAENIADNGGMRQAFSAYQSWVRDHGAERKLPGLKYTPNQLLFISNGNARCLKYKPEMLKVHVTTQYHSPQQFRVNGPLSNLPEFSKEFQCPPGSPMNPHKKCQVW